MGTVTNLWTWKQRKATGDEHEDIVRREMEHYGWTVDPYGQAVLSETARRVLQLGQSRVRWDPDFLVTRGTDQFWVDAKSSMYRDGATYYTVSKQALVDGVLVYAWTLMPVYYVFHNLGVATPSDVVRFCNLRHPIEIPGAYVSFPTNVLTSFEDVFGPPPQVVNTLRAVA